MVVQCEVLVFGGDGVVGGNHHVFSASPLIERSPYLFSFDFIFFSASSISRFTSPLHLACLDSLGLLLTA